MARARIFASSARQDIRPIRWRWNPRASGDFALAPRRPAGSRPSHVSDRIRLFSDASLAAQSGLATPASVMDQPKSQESVLVICVSEDRAWADRLVDELMGIGVPAGILRAEFDYTQDAAPHETFERATWHDQIRSAVYVALLWSQLAKSNRQIETAVAAFELGRRW